ncbi:glycosyltransferase [Rhizobium sp. 57MFTsu3.2]|uniref:glycosyltransferase n=1 Tax=Rhizobium sp. 57MFTsu3.2 TaxID=1048681 RepID=UPI00146F6F9B|nr:glycosyltransferase [Rhizobium sp. 57MFTsu3.2]
MLEKAGRKVIAALVPLVQRMFQVQRNPSQSDYDENYYRCHCGGLPYNRSEPHWSRFFGIVAERVAQDIRPRTVFDAGCAMGFLVEELRKRHVEAFGRDYSEYAISEIPDALRPFCELGSIVDPIEGSFDLVTCIEVLEHLPEGDGRRAISNLCAAGPLILFSSSPDDIDEPTHLNVRPPIHWLRLFREHGFGPRSDFDASFLCPWAMLLERRAQAPTDEELHAYASLILMRMEYFRHTHELRQAQDRQLVAIKNEIHELRQTHALTVSDLMQKQLVALAAADRAQTTVDQLLASKSWRMTAPYRWAGHQGRRAQHVMRALPLMAKRQGGYLNLARKAWSIMAREGLSGARSVWRNSNAQINTSSNNDYEKWLRTYATLDDPARARIRRDIDGFANQPLISIVMPVYNAEPNWLAEAIDSVRNQLYPHWELCIADDCSTSEAVRPVLERYAAIDPRIKVFHRPTNGHISEASNSGIEMATGDWMALLDQDDLLSEDALFYVARTINEKPQIELIYSDEDKISSGKRFDPYFKPDWNPDLLRSHNVICHLGVYKLDRVRSIGGFRKGYEGAQDHDLVLRFTDQLSEAQIVHIPRVLYHWRSHASSTAQSGGNKSYAALAGQNAVSDHLKRKGISGRVEILPTGMYRTLYDLPEEPPLVSLIIPTRNGLRLLRKCVESILQKTDYPNYEIVIIDNNSDDPATLEYFRQIETDSRIFVTRDEQPFNYSLINNGAVSRARGDFVGLINNDIEVISPNWLSEMMSHAIQAGVGVVGARLWYPDDRLQHGGVVLGIGGVAGHAHKFLRKGAHGYFSRGELTQTFSAVTAACLVVRKSTYEAVEGLDQNLTVAFNDVDFCLKVREAGWRNVWTPFAELYHHESATRGSEDTPQKKERFRGEVMHMLAKWGEKLIMDPAYNPNLTLDREDFSLAWPPRNQSDPTLAS